MKSESLSFLCKAKSLVFSVLFKKEQSLFLKRVNSSFIKSELYFFGNFAKGKVILPYWIVYTVGRRSKQDEIHQIDEGPKRAKAGGCSM